MDYIYICTSQWIQGMGVYMLMKVSYSEKSRDYTYHINIGRRSKNTMNKMQA